MTQHPAPLPTDFTRRSTYLALLNEQLERRKRDHGRAFLTPQEDARLRAEGLRLSQRYADLHLLDEATRPRRTR